jgi:uncharacterized protein Yka (UPF0111/DUF47 family)
MEEEKAPSVEMKVLDMLQEIGRAIVHVSKQVDKLEEKVHALGKAMGESYDQTKRVVEHLTEAVDETRQDLSTYGGTITASTWDVPSY